MKACVGTAAATSMGSSSCPWKEASRRAVGEAGRDGGEPKPWRPGQEEGRRRRWRVRFCLWAQMRPGHWTGGGKTERVRFGPRPK